MNKEIQPKTKNVKFQCTSCNSNFNINSTYKLDVYHVDICSNCHPWYLGKTNTNAIKGKSEKLNNKFEIGKQFNNKKSSVVVKKTSRKSNNKKISNFKDVKISD